MRVVVEIEGFSIVKGMVSKKQRLVNHKRQSTTFVELEEKPERLSNI